MEVTLFGFLVGLCFAVGAWFIFLWAIKDGQFRDVEKPAHDMLENDKRE